MHDFIPPGRQARQPGGWAGRPARAGAPWPAAWPGALCCADCLAAAAPRWHCFRRAAPAGARSLPQPPLLYDTAAWCQAMWLAVPVGDGMT